MLSPFSMFYRLQFVPYRRPFAVPMRSARGVWFEREGVLLRLEDGEGRVGYGEIAPLDGFGSESVAEACAYLASLGEKVDQGVFMETPVSLRCTRFALSSALWGIETPEISYTFANCALLPAGGPAMEAVVPLLNEGFRTFKLKLGVENLNNELALVNGILGVLPPEARLRLDANGSMSSEDLKSWQTFLESNEAVEFLEQPFQVGQEKEMMASSSAMDVPMALDESVASVESLEQICTGLRWPGFLIAKSSIMGSVEAQQRVLHGWADRVVVSSAFESGIGMHAVFRLAASMGVCRAVGFGTLAFFADPLSGFELRPEITSKALGVGQLEHIWKAVCSEFVLS
jgi:O-succinylbenzoate synthase